MRRKETSLLVESWRQFLVEGEEKVNTKHNSKDMKALHDALRSFINSYGEAGEKLDFNNMFPHFYAHGDGFGLIFHQASKSSELKKILDEFEMDIKGRIEDRKKFGQEDENFKSLERVLKSYNHIKGDEELAQYLKSIDKQYQS
tara:strand:+ start:56 stop:487 length:432 start_codon:yes stop_codon:yes gene_type:complete